MRRLAALVVVALLAMIPAVGALGETASYADDFSEVSYSGNDGILHFAGAWQEAGDDGAPGSGDVHVAEDGCSGNRCLHVDGRGPVLTSYGIQRSADASVFGSARLRFDIAVDASPLDVAPLEIAKLLVQASTGGGWTTLQSFDLSDSSEASVNLPVNSYLAEGFAVRFVVSGASDGGLVFNGTAIIDNVEVSGALIPTTTSTTTTTSTSTSTTSTTTTTARNTTPTTPTTPPTPTTPTTTSRPGRSTTAPTTTSTVATTTTTSTTTTTLAAVTGFDDTTPDPPEFEPGIHDMGPGQGLMTDYHEVNGEVVQLEDVEVLSAEVTADFSLAVEAFKSTKVWLATLSLMIAAALVSGMDHRRLAKGEFATLSSGEPLMEG